MNSKKDKSAARRYFDLLLKHHYVVVVDFIATVFLFVAGLQPNSDLSLWGWVAVALLVSYIVYALYDTRKKYIVVATLIVVGIVILIVGVCLIAQGKAMGG